MFLVKTVWIYQMRTWKFSVKTVCRCFNIKILVKSHGHRYGVWENHNINWDQRFWHADIQLVGSWLACIVQYSYLSPLLSIWFNTFVLCLVLSPIILICPPLNRVVDTSGTCSFKYEFFPINSEQPIVQMHRTYRQTPEWCRSRRSWEQSVFHLQQWWFCMTTHCIAERLQWTSCGNPVLWHSMPATCKHNVKCGVSRLTDRRNTVKQMLCDTSKQNMLWGPAVGYYRCRG